MDFEEISACFQELESSGWVEGDALSVTYYFYGNKRGKLYEAGEEMKGYNFEVSEITEDPTEKGVFWINTSKTEVLNPAQMEDKVEQLEELALDYGIFFDRFELEF